jgi:hypothetical protein
MLISEKVNLKKYILFSLPILFLALFLSRNSNEIKVMLTVFVAACLNQWMLVNLVLGMTRVASGEGSVDKTQVVIMFIGKVLVLVVALTLGVQIMGKRIIIPVLIYVLQIGVLFLSLNKTKKE